MPWKVTGPMQQRQQFIRAWSLREHDVTTLCARFEVSRKTAYKWIHRYEQGGFSALSDRSRRPLTSSVALAIEEQQRLLDVRLRHPTWGPRKVLAWLKNNHPELELPAASTVGELFKRHGLVKTRRRPAHAQPSLSLTQPLSPNSVFCMDFKGWFRTKDGARCNPLTVTDDFSRFLLACKHLDRTTQPEVQQVLEWVFREYGLPVFIRSDNGTPFASTGLKGLSKLAVWLIHLGVLPERIRPGKPQENGRHERMHRTLKQETATPPSATLRQQQHAFDRFRHEYNWERPHEALENRPPGRVYVKSTRAFPRRLPELEYLGMKPYRVRPNGTFHCRGKDVFVSEALIGERIGLEEVGDGLWLIHFGPLKLALFDEREKKIDPDVDSFLSAEADSKVLPMSPV